MMAFADMLKAWREPEDVSQTVFAKKLGLPEVGVIQLALKDYLVKEGFDYDVTLEPA
ncbi:MAG: hypothetical protein K2X47_04500 [Bdellovibrionales bacterium]|nr:hypothetical protein [Bdellovibrionales bacterium]